MITIRDHVPAALGDVQLQKNLRFTIDNSLKSRDAAVAEVPNWQELRDYASRVKDHTLSRLGDYLVQLEEKVLERGGKVIWAETAEDAVSFLKELVREKNVRNVVKSKTMLGEEIGVNEALEEVGVEVVETDLGEYIVQLCGEKPFHIVTPAMHKSRRQVADLFVERLGMERSEDIAVLTATARRVLRDRFLQADLGITGANFGIAETGTVVVVENEGNARLSLSLPKIQVTLMGIEKMIPRVVDLPVFLKLLTRSATGQRITSYVNLISGPRRPGEIDGPEEFYLVLVDNGRSSILADPHLQETLRCIRCGCCLNSCPVFQRIGGHAYDSVYQGPIGAILTPQLLSAAAAPEHPFASSLCGACREVCPVKIDIPHILLRLRNRVKMESSARGEARWEKLGMRLWAWFFSSPGRYRLAGRVMRWFSPLVVRRGRLRPAFPPISHWQAGRDLPEIPKRSFRELYSKRGSE